MRGGGIEKMLVKFVCLPLIVVCLLVMAGDLFVRYVLPVIAPVHLVCAVAGAVISCAYSYPAWKSILLGLILGPLGAVIAVVKVRSGLASGTVKPRPYGLGKADVAETLRKSVASWALKVTGEGPAAPDDGGEEHAPAPRATCACDGCAMVYECPSASLGLSLCPSRHDASRPDLWPAGMAAYVRSLGHRANLHAVSDMVFEYALYDLDDVEGAVADRFGMTRDEASFVCYAAGYPRLRDDELPRDGLAAHGHLLYTEPLPLGARAEGRYV